jgi:uncharacterized membrane protein YeaQ/YmgE (transglycosylase-associated protein family)
MTLFICLVVGGIVGLIAAQMKKEHGYGLVADIAIGAIGGQLGGALFVSLGITSGGVVGSIITAIIGSAALIAAFYAAKRAGTFSS